MFDYSRAFSRNIGWVTTQEQERLRNAKVAIGGLGGVGGDHAIVCSRLGIGHFHIADLDTFDLSNFNRQAGASMSTIGKDKSAVVENIIKGINPTATINNWEEGIQVSNIDDFLDGVDVYIDSLDIFAIDIRRKVFAACYDKGIPCITAAPMGMGTSMLIFMPGQMSFEEYFRIDGLSHEDQIIHFIMGVSPSMMQVEYLKVNDSVNFKNKDVPSTPMGVSLAAGVLVSNVLKLILKRGDVIAAPWGLHFDAYKNRLVKTWRPWGNDNPIQKYLIYPRLKKMFKRD
ncbi:ThiF family adenylyltransferase [Aestuariibacter sp. AA17]|uniref:ThiF family adenylyltransferase n=1 Tax=Fluctibacter corallii TaxID=2984329 RepID=A0ABT3A682_9ALTE|nr:ThiF family adenylyltransferase [Aestuariibacter sp. AA17]MCV2884193.1 ThiF family adenylyltransferase [Aestuariibacter sp. AA17]